MLNVLRYNFRIYFRVRDNFIWNLIFPFAYILIFTMALSSLGSSTGNLPVVNIAIVEEKTPSEEASPFQNALTFDDFLSQLPSEEATLEDGAFRAPADSPLLLYKKTDADTALQWLKDGVTDATVNVGGEKTSFEVAQKDSGFDKSMILQGILDAFEQSRANAKQITLALQEGRITPDEIPSIVKRLSAEEAKKIDTSLREQSLDSTNIYYYAMIAYVSFFPVNAGVEAVRNTEANNTLFALRSAISPQSKRRRFFVSFLPPLVIHLVLTVVFFFFLQVLSVGLEEQLGLTLLLLLTTTLTALFTGTAIGSLFGRNQGLCAGISIALPLFLGFTSGMMNDGIRNTILQQAPWFHRMNPVGNTSNALAILNSGGGTGRFWNSYYPILIFCAVMAAITLVGMRRNRYDSL